MMKQVVIVNISKMEHRMLSLGPNLTDFVYCTILVIFWPKYYNYSV